MKRLLVATAALGLVGSAYAAPACSNLTLFNLAAGAVGTVYTAINTGSGNGTYSCSANGELYSNFQVLVNSGSDVGNIFNMSVTANPSTSSGFQFGINLTPGQDYQFEYEISPIGITGMTLTNGGSGLAFISELICNDPVLVVQGGNGANCGSPSNQLGNTGAGAGATSTITVNPTTTGADWIFKDLNAGGSSTSGLSEFGQTFIPEPMTLSLMGAGLVGFGLLRRKLKR